MKRLFKLCVGLIMMMLVIGGYIYFTDIEGRIFTFVKNNYEELEDISEKHIASSNSFKYVYDDRTIVTDTSYDIYEEYKGVEVERVYKGEHTIVQYFYTGRGIVPASTYYGFYYSPEDVPVAYNNIDIELKQISDNEWEWAEENSDNGGIIIKIMDKWYYYKAWF